MAWIGNITQEPADELDYDVDCTDLCAGGDAVASVTAAVTPAGLTVSALVSSATSVKLWISGGADGTTYKIDVTVTTSQGRRKQDELKVRVKEV